MRITSSGQTIATLSVATDRRVKAGTTPTTDWHRVICWDRLAEITAEHVTKGRLLLVEGAVIYRTWEDQQRQQHTMTEILARELVLLDRPPMTTQAHVSGDRTSAARDRAATGDDPV